MKNIILEINKNDCIGDSVGKHNFNFLSLDSNICNLSSTFYNIPYNYKKLFLEYESYIPTLTAAYNEYNSGSMFRYDLCETTVNLMSSFWGKHEFTVSLNTNISFDYDPNFIGLITNNLSIPLADRKNNFITLEKKCTEYLNVNFNPTTFLKNTTAHVIACYFSNIQYKDGTTTPNMSSVVSFTPNINIDAFQTINFTNNNGNLSKFIEYNVTKPSVHISGFYIFSYANLGSGNKWALIRVLPENTLKDLELSIEYSSTATSTLI
jgi:hypothetical protein